MTKSGGIEAGGVVGVGPLRRGTAVLVAGRCSEVEEQRPPDPTPRQLCQDVAMSAASGPRTKNLGCILWEILWVLERCVVSDTKKCMMECNRK